MHFKFEKERSNFTFSQEVAGVERQSGRPRLWHVPRRRLGFVPGSAGASVLRAVQASESGLPRLSPGCVDRGFLATSEVMPSFCLMALDLSFLFFFYVKGRSGHRQDECRSLGGARHFIPADFFVINAETLSGMIITQASFIH